MAQNPVGGSAKADLLRGLDESFRSFIQAAESVPSLRPADGAWGPLEVLCHIDGWHLSAAERLEQMAGGGEVLSPGEADALNARFVAERRDLSGPQLLVRVRESFSRMRSAADALTDAQYSRGEAGNLDSLAYFIVNANGQEHYAEHLEDLKAVRP